MAPCEWILRRNCSISPRQLGAVFVALCATSLLVAIAFAIRGAWYVLGFSLLEMTAVAVAFFWYARHVNDCERIELRDDYLVVELTELEQVRQIKLDVNCARVMLPETHRDLVALESQGVKVEVGRYLTEKKRCELAKELRCALVSKKN